MESKGELFAWLANTGHWPDVGGMVPGGFSASATEVEQEGLRLPPIKFWKKGEMDQEILSIILSNIRIADQRIGDIKAQAAALTTGEQRLTEFIDRYGAGIDLAGIVAFHPVDHGLGRELHGADEHRKTKLALCNQRAIDGVVNAVGAIHALGDHRRKGRADERQIHLVADLDQPILDDRKRNRVEVRHGSND